MVGYWNQPALTGGVLRGGWLRTGDLGHVDADGYLYLDDRAKDVVTVNGDNIYCLPVEAALSRHPGVAQAAVVGRHSDVTGEEVCAFLVPAPGLAPGRAVASQACGLVAKALAPAHRPTTVFWESSLSADGPREAGQTDAAPVGGCPQRRSPGDARHVVSGSWTDWATLGSGCLLKAAPQRVLRPRHQPGSDLPG
ncbi:hypothetical protein ABZ471_40850 [Streptomyces sp. NPDC005728]|uniref:AMP-binding enzyme n=1 Tax=Streptomyces sp. NPDC005728 TaxID=3157054 RepID=UPI0033F91CE0